MDVLALYNWICSCFIQILGFLVFIWGAIKRCCGPYNKNVWEPLCKKFKHYMHWFTSHCFVLALHISPSQPIRCCWPLPGRVSSPLCWGQGATHLSGKDQECQRGNNRHVAVIKHTETTKTRLKCHIPNGSVKVSSSRSWAIVYRVLCFSFTIIFILVTCFRKTKNPCPNRFSGENQKTLFVYCYTVLGFLNRISGLMKTEKLCRTAEVD